MWQKVLKKSQAQRMHLDERPFVCKTCDKKFRQVFPFMKTFHHPFFMKFNNFNLSNIIKEHDRNIWNQVENLIRHNTVEHKRWNNSNVICAKKFPFSTVLKNYIELVHDKFKNFKCNLCDKSFAYNHQYEATNHKEGEREKFKCNLCGKELVKNNTSL